MPIGMRDRVITKRLRALALLLGTAAANLPAPAMAQGVEDAETMAVIVDRLTFFRVQDLQFGGILPGTTAGVVRVLPDGNRTATGGVTLVGSNHQPARFAGMGTYNRYVRIRLSSNTIQLTGPGAPMTVSQFELGSTPNTTILSTAWNQFRIASTNGVFNFPIGARVNVNANQREGTYTGTFSVTLDYL